MALSGLTKTRAVKDEVRFNSVRSLRVGRKQATAALEQPHLEKSSDKNGEARTLAICPETHRLIAVVYTMRGEVCRIISARAARKNEQEQYRQLHRG
ncbi:BrnT family toxin [Rhizobium aquaticum]|uniref:BrnT family toxin n=1 Tax=Rhizobium aquaticum TaxID=1549636 RepID=UPI0033982626